MYLLDKHSRQIRTQSILFLVISFGSVCCFTALTKKRSPQEGMPCIYAGCTQEPLLAHVFTSRANKARPELNSVTWILLERKKTSRFGPLFLRALAYLGS